MDLNSSGDSYDLEEDFTTGSDESPESSPSPRRGRIRKGRLRSTSPIIPLSDPKEGDIVWAKVKSYRWWPAMLVNKEACGKLAFDGRTRAGLYVYWFGDERVSLVAKSNLVDFKKGYQRFKAPSGGKSFKSGVYLAIKEIRKSLVLDTDGYDINSALAWAEDGFPLPEEYAGTHYDTVPQHVQKKLKILSAKYEENEDEEEVGEDDDEEDEEPIISPEEEDLMHSIRDGSINLNDVCLACLSQENALEEHPYFNGSICSPCRVKLSDCYFSIGLDMIAFHCSICINPGKMMVCSQPYCYRAFCLKCIILKATFGVLDCIREADLWLCFMCSPFTSEMHGLLKPRVDWKKKMWQTFHAKIPDEMKLSETPLRVLCLDGSCDTVLSVFSFLKKIDVNVDTLFLSNSNDSQLQSLNPDLWRCKYAIKSVNASDDPEELSSLAPIHLLIASPEDEEKESFGTKFFLSHNIRAMLQVLNEACNAPFPMMWIFQMPPPYWPDYVIPMSRYLQFDPAVWSKEKGKDEHLVWTNISAMWAFLEDAAPLQKKYQPLSIKKKPYTAEDLDQIPDD